jgi:hypothetical protein
VEDVGCAADDMKKMGVFSVHFVVQRLMGQRRRWENKGSGYKLMGKSHADGASAVRPRRRPPLAVRFRRCVAEVLRVVGTRDLSFNWHTLM